MSGQFQRTTVFNNVTTFAFAIDIADPLVRGGSYSNPALNGVIYSVRGSLPSGSPSGFPSFALSRTIGGTEFYSQGSSLSFAISATADLTDGLQLDELAGAGLVFELNAREVNTGRYHPALFLLYADGTGLLQNSNNTGGVNPSSHQVVDVALGEEYITSLTFDPASVTVTPPIPAPASWLLLGTGVAGFAAAMRSKAVGKTRSKRQRSA